jgi:hypothetical protein
VTLPNGTLDGGGAVVGPGNLRVLGPFNWRNGLMDGTGTTTFAETATVTLGSPADKYVQGGRAVNNLGTVNWVDGHVFVRDGGSVTNQPGGAFNVLGSQLLDGLTNGGALTKTGGGSARIGYFKNLDTGTVDVQGGTLEVTTGDLAGAFHVVGGATVLFATRGNYDTIAVRDGASFDGEGVYQINLGGYAQSMSFAGEVSVTNVDLSAGPLTGPGNLTVYGTFNWTGGMMSGDPVSGTGTTSIAEGATCNISGPAAKYLDKRTLDNAGTTLWNGGNVTFQSGGTLNVQPGGEFDILSDDMNLNGSGIFRNFGTLTKANLPGTTSVAAGIAFDNDGLLSLLSGTLSFAGAYTQNLGTTQVLAGATLAAGGSGVTVEQGGTLAGTGTVRANVLNRGTVSPAGDGAVGTLTIDGNYTQDGTGALNIDLDGAMTHGADYDWLNVTGNAQLDGTLNVTFLPDYTPAVGDSFTVLTARAVTGTFAAVNVFNLDPAFQLAVTYHPGDVTLAVALV